LFISYYYLLLFDHFQRSTFQNNHFSIATMSSSSHFGTPQHNIISPFIVAVKVEVEDEVVLEVTPDDNLHDGSQVPESFGGTP